jgi:hypothetical protein
MKTQDYPSCIDENLYLGGSRDAKNFDALKGNISKS